MKIFFIALLIIFPAIAYTQKVEIEKNKILVDNKEWAGFAKEGGCDLLANICNIELSSLSGKKEIVVRMLSFKDWKEVSRYNKEGTVWYWEFTFLSSRQKADMLVRYNSKKDEKLAKDLVKAGFFKDGEIDPTAVDNFVLINGTKLSQRAGN